MQQDIPKSGDRVRLTGKTRHGKNRINQHGDVWVVENSGMALGQGTIISGSAIGRFRGREAIGLRSLNKTEGPKDRETGERLFDRRWVLVRGDENFTWENHGA